MGGQFGNTLIEKVIFSVGISIVQNMLVYLLAKFLLYSRDWSKNRSKFHEARVTSDITNASASSIKLIPLWEL